MSKGVKAINVLITRPEQQAEALSQLVEQQGWNAVRFPTLEIVATDVNNIKQQLKTIDCYYWVIFISVNAVNFALSANDGKIDCFNNTSIAAVGKATEKALLAAGITVDLVPETEFNTEGLLATDAMKHVKDQAILIVRGQGGREELANSLQQRGANTEYLDVYARKIPSASHLVVTEMLQQGVLSLITITSGDALKNLLAMIDHRLHDKLQNVPIVVISHRIKKIAEQYKFKTIAVTNKPGDAAMIETVMNMLSAELSNI